MQGINAHKVYGREDFGSESICNYGLVNRINLGILTHFAELLVRYLSSRAEKDVFYKVFLQEESLK